MVIYFTFQSCSDSLCDSLYTAVDEIYNSKNDLKEVDLSEVYSFKWDTLYIFTEYAGPEFINETIGFSCDCEGIEEEHEKLYLFVKDKKVAKQEVGKCDGYSIKTTLSICCDGDQKVGVKNAQFSISGSRMKYHLTQVDRWLGTPTHNNEYSTLSNFG